MALGNRIYRQSRRYHNIITEYVAYFPTCSIYILCMCNVQAAAEGKENF